MATRAESAPGVDPELALIYGAYPVPAVLTPELIPTLRTAQAALYNEVTMTAAHPISHKEYSFKSYDGYEVIASVFTPTGTTHSNSSRPCIYYIHGGGLIMGNRFLGIDITYPLAQELGAVVISIEYRLAPEHKAPSASEDAYAGLLWATKNYATLGIDPKRILVWGSSSGGGLAAALGLMVRDRKPSCGLHLKGLLLHYPMLDNLINEDDKTTFSGRAAPAWSSETHKMAWEQYLGSNSSKLALDPYVVPARANDLSRLPPVLVDVGSAELFRRPAAKFAQDIWEAGGLVEVHVAGGAFHGSDLVATDARVTKRAIQARTSWGRDMLES
ncbi:unnamed protein product [Clonostachys rosea f. rosea IK726]|jgi:acetyl esterase/lipase|uniref:Uncharacterized protein n=1 Tax=Clonostachys rosea f. rosea IK726 TaxID=1349383 RepID=A0ACA9U089_BIOOC|nr:unnamed protein product [Clonostachys rosea f. rosea IK726]